MALLPKLQRRTLPKAQIIAYFITLLIGTTIILTTIQFYQDIRPLLKQESNLFDKNSVVISKTISLFDTANKKRIYFTEEEIDGIRTQNFVNNVAPFHTANFDVRAYLTIPGSDQTIYTDLFFESVPDQYLDVLPEDWNWEEGSRFIPVIIPETYLSLYNFGFAESKNLPVISGNMLSHFSFTMTLSGRNKTTQYDSRIVGFSNKINSILVPEDFLLWANKEYGRQEDKISRILIEFAHTPDEQTQAFLDENSYSVNKTDMEQSRMVFFFRIAMGFVAFVALIIILLSVGFVLLSINLVTQKNKELILNLYNIGYSSNRIAAFYRRTTGLITLFSVSVSMIASTLIRHFYLNKFSSMFEYTAGSNLIWLYGTILLIVLLISYNILLNRSIRNITNN